LLAFKSHDIKQAKKLFKEASQQGSSIASLNFEILKGKATDGVDVQAYGFEKELKESFLYKTIKGKLSFGFDHLPNSDYCKAEFNSDYLRSKEKVCKHSISS
jgi:hypothetical protein